MLEGCKNIPAFTCGVQTALNYNFLKVQQSILKLGSLQSDIYLLFMSKINSVDDRQIGSGRMVAEGAFGIHAVSVYMPPFPPCRDMVDWARSI